MLINRILLLIFIIASGVFASFYGGNVSYALFYMSLFIPVVSLSYTFYVYVRFRIFQEIGQRVVVKGDLVPYSFTLANEDYITFRSIKVNFLHDKSTITDVQDIKEYCLLPSQSETLRTNLRCNYRGEYYVGANTVDIIDYLYLFKITYPVSSKLKVTVLPRVIQIPRIGFVPALKDTKNSPYLRNAETDAMDIETRRYNSGDSRKQIHWKVSAKRNELFSRKNISNPKSEIIILMDLKRIHEDTLSTLITEDQIIESGLAIANYCKDNNTRVKIYYEQSGVKAVSVRSKADFELFYQTTMELHFQSQVSLEELLSSIQIYEEAADFYMLITHELTFDLYKTMLWICENGSDLSLLLIKDEIAPEEEDIIKSLKQSGIVIKLITREDEIGEVLNA
ncbi:DUF58 domain-containing protein [Anaerocolumna sp. AGMB13025]|uniref:DUF58 domain-containing protein n=1 Tax=Anaerocolumna sp. AGMB13025 TaxID=3039116 RepID=UPI0024202017|nr:DUF58 domain-containing protein [Anaerocolumna sp. AGMB13025]WFR57365.1 DUF58 domain-containing protein [Anaerocolumna sp. AGMB13025]